MRKTLLSRLIGNHAGRLSLRFWQWAGSIQVYPKHSPLVPHWLFPALVLALSIPGLVFYHTGRHRLNAIFGFTVDGLLTVGLIISVILLIDALPTKQRTPQQLLLSAASLWITNILVFALWYWRLDAGGPYQRDKVPGHSDGAFLFPQMTMSKEALRESGQQNWSPNFIDYLFLAFNTSTAFSPTDVPVLARWAKDLNDAAIAALAADHCTTSRARRQHSVIAAGLTKACLLPPSFSLDLRSHPPLFCQQ